MNKKGSFLFDLIVWIIIGIVVVLFFGIWMYGADLMNNALSSVPSITINNHTQNVSQVVGQTLGQVNTAQQRWLPIIAFIIMVTEALVILITSFFIKEHPLLFIPYVFIVAIAIVVAVVISNFYQGLLSGQAFSAYLQQFTMSNYILIYLPWWVAVIGAVGGILLMANIIIDRGQI